MGQDRVHELEQAYRKRRKGFLAWAERATRNFVDAEDLVQDAFASALGSAESLSGVDDLEAWLFASVRNKARDRWRRKETRRQAGEVYVPLETLTEIAESAGLDPEELALSSELLDALEDAIEELPPEQRAVIEAQTLDGQTFKEMAEASGVSQDTLAARKRYAVKKLAAALDEWLDI